MGLKIFNADEFNVKLKATIHASGKLGFTEATASALQMTNEAGVKFAIDEDNENELYLIYCKKIEKGAFKVNKAGDYFYVNAKSLFDALGYDYKNENIMFDMIESKEYGEYIYKLKKRAKPRKEK